LFDYFASVGILPSFLSDVGVFEVKQDALLLHLLVVVSNDLAEYGVVRINGEVLLVNEPGHVVFVYRLPRVEATQDPCGDKSKDNSEDCRNDQTGKLEASLLSGVVAKSWSP
jgi:hypothetical protein